MMTEWDELIEDECRTCEHSQSECTCGDEPPDINDDDGPAVCEHGVDLHITDCRKCIGAEMDDAFFGGK